MVAINVRGPFFASQAVLPHLRRHGGGRIVNVASQMAQIAERTTADSDLLARKLAYMPANRYADPDEIAEVIEFLLTTKATFLQGHDLVVDGGYTIH